MKRAACTIVLAGSLVLPASAPAQSPPPGPSPHLCLIGSSYSVRVVRGDVTCTRAKRVLRYFLANDRSPRGWRSRYARGGEQWAAQCRSRDRTKLVRARALPS